MPSIKSKRLKLSDFETQTSRFILLADTIEEIQKAIVDGYVTFTRSDRDRRLWQQLLENDLVISLSFEGVKLSTNAFRVTGKGIKFEALSPFPDESPFLVFLDHVGSGTATNLQSTGYFSSDFIPYLPRPIFQALWEECQPVSKGAGSSAVEWQLPGTRIFSVTIASSAEDYEFISNIALRHPFGERRAFVTLVAKRQEVRLGAILMERALETPTHRAGWRVFRNKYPSVQQNAVSIVRIYSSPKAPSKWSLHRELIEAAIVVAPSLVSKPLTIIDGVSYDYHPVSMPLGFQVEVPNKIEGSFYYWKPFNLSSEQASDDSKKVIDRRREIHKLLNTRRSTKYWLAPGKADSIARGVQKRSWAIRRSVTNNGMWRSLTRNDVVFFVSRDNRVAAYGVVMETSLRSIPGLEQFPLWMDFSDVVDGLDVSLVRNGNQRWIDDLRFSGLVPLPEEYGAHLRLVCEEQKKEGKMWVEPNPYLLHRTEFEKLHNQVFVIQSWSLRETIFPIIKQVLEDSGFSVRYSGDRDGQVIFEDVWLMLNESEIALVDFTNKRPNVYLEYGMALVLGKPIVAITQDKDDIPSDTPNLKYIIYKNQLGDAALNKLPKAIADTMLDLQKMREKRIM